MGSPPATPGLDTLVRRAEERLRQLQLTEVTPEAPGSYGLGPFGDELLPSGAPLDAGPGRALAAATGAAADGTMRTGTMRGSLPAKSNYLADGELPEWLQPPGTYGGAELRATDGAKEESRDALLSRGSNVSVAESTTVGIVRRAEEQFRRLDEYEEAVAEIGNVDVSAGELPQGHPSRGGGAMRAMAERERVPDSPAPSEGGAQGVEERLQWLRQLESQLGMEGVVIEPAEAVPGAPHPDSYDVAERVERVERREAAMKEAEELDELLLKYLEQ